MHRFEALTVTLLLTLAGLNSCVDIPKIMWMTNNDFSGASKFLIDAILFVLFLGVVGYIVKIVYDSSK